MTSFLRAKQAGMQNDLSATILPHLFNPDEQSRYGINSQISCVAYDPVQSLLAIGTNETKFGPGKIYVFGQQRVQKFMIPLRRSSIRDLQFCANRLISLDAASELAIWNLNTGERIASYAAAGAIHCVVTDPMLDWALLGLHSGEVVAYDLDRERMSPFRIPNFWREKDARARNCTLLGMQLHPRDIGQLLIAYTTGAVIYSFKQNRAIKFFEYTVPPGAPGGNGEGQDTLRKPRLVHATWHPTGTFILTAHDDGSLVFWDPKDGRLVLARTIDEHNVNQPGSHTAHPKFLHPYTRIDWCCKENPDDTGLLIAGGLAHDTGDKGLTFIVFGQTPVYQTSSWQILGEHLKGKRQVLLKTPPGADVSNYCLLPRRSPHFAGAQDPIAILAVLTSGELITLSFPTGYPISPTNQLHPSLSFVHPFVSKVAVTTLDRGRWLGMVEKRDQGETLLKGGAEATKPRRRYEGRNIIQVAHVDSTVRIWDVGHADEMENPCQLQVDVARALGRYDDVAVSAMAMAPNTGEFAVGTKTGEVVMYRWDGNKYFGQDRVSNDVPSNPGGLSNIAARAEPSLKEGLQPFSLYEMMQGPISALQVSDVGFVAAGSENGYLSIIDLRGPAIIFQASMSDLARPEKRSSVLGRHASAQTAKEWPTVIEFGVMTLEGDNYSSIACFVGTNVGKVVTLKLLPSSGSYTVNPVGSVDLKGPIVAICPIESETGKPAAATGATVSGLRNGQQVHGTLVVVSQTEARIFKPASSKGASKSFDDIFCQSAAVADFELQGHALVGVFGDNTTRAYSLPGLKEINKAPLPMLDSARRTESLVASTGDVFGWAGPSELVVLPVWGSGKTIIENTKDTLINPALAIPPRPTISNVQWITGTQYMSPLDLDLLIGGPDRPASKRMVLAAAEEERLARGGQPQGPARSGAGAGSSQEGWGDYLTRQLNERTEKLNIMGDSMDNLQESSSRWADDVGKYVSKQKRNLIFGSIKGSFK